MSMLNYSPWRDAGNAMSSAGSSYSNAMWKLAQLNQTNQLRDRDSAIRFAELAMQQALKDAQIKHYQEQDKSLQARTAIDQAILEASQKYGAYARPSVDMSQGPTRDAAAGLRHGDMIQQALTAIALQGDLGTYLRPHNVGQDQLSINPLTGEQIAGPRSPLVLGSGQTAFDPTSFEPQARGGVTLSPQQMRFEGGPSGPMGMTAENPNVPPRAAGGGGPTPGSRVNMLNDALTALIASQGISGMRTNPVARQKSQQYQDAIQMILQTSVPELGMVATNNQPPPTSHPKPGEIRKGYRYLGGDPASPNSWEKVSQ